jgi:hypothetical protein
MSASPLPPKWVVEMNTPLAKKPKAGNVRNPPGFAAKPTGKQVAIPTSILYISKQTQLTQSVN